MECLLEDDISSACEEYGQKLGELATLLEEQKPKIEMLKNLADEMQQIKLSVPDPAAAADSPELRAALSNAKDVASKSGADSNEAKVAWDEVEELASTGLKNAVGVRLDEECLVETAIDACAALEELNRVMSLTQEDTRYSG